MTKVHTATCSAAEPVRILERFPLTYLAGANIVLDRPAHVRAASGVCWLQGKLAIIQDDAAFVALVSPGDLQVEAVALPMLHGMRQFDKSRGNKKHKRDLEACFSAVIDGTPHLFALGSGSSPEREFVMRVKAMPGGYGVDQIEARALYARLRAQLDFAGSELNLEGAALRGDHLVLFQRGNGAPSGMLKPKNATAQLHFAELLRYLNDTSTTPPEPMGVIEHDLGTIEDVRLTFTDASPGPAHTLLFVASAEASPNAVDDGIVVGSVLGTMDADGHCSVAPLVDELGQPCRDKVEGVVLDEQDPSQVWLVVDPDDHETPGSLLRAKLTAAFV